jgi:uncharacterized NAD(P)/FAD-binding protein YdhS
MFHSIAIIGVGPRGVYALDSLTRVLATFPRESHVHLHLIEPAELGAGAIYRTAQPEYLLMNTVVSQLTAFVDERTAPDDPFEPGPSMYDWMKARGSDIGPDDYPSRAEHGRYLVDAVRTLRARQVPNFTIHVHACRALDIERDGARHRVVLSCDFAPVLADVVLLTTGHSSHQCSKQDELSAFAEEMRRLGRSEIAYYPSIYPVEQRIEPLGPHQTLGVLGLGLTAIDGIASATEGKGGRFERNAAGKLIYVASGREPKIISWSLPGLPPSARGVNQKGATFRHEARILTRMRVEHMREVDRAKGGTGQLDFEHQVFPLLKLEMEYIYYTTLCGTDFGDRYLEVAEDPQARAELLSEVEPKDRFSWDSLQDPLAGKVFASRDDFEAWLREYILADLAEAALGNMRGPMKAATDLLRDLRGTLRSVVEYGGLTAESHRWFDRTLWPHHNRICAGPPAVRLEQLVALMDAGVLDITAGPTPSLTVDAERGCFRLTPTAFPGEGRDIHVLVDGRIQMPCVTTDRSQLLTRLLAKGEVRPFTNCSGDAQYTPCGIEITRDNRVVAADGSVSETFYAMGILAEGSQLYTLVAAAPGVAARPLMEARGWAVRVYEQLRRLEEADLELPVTPQPVQWTDTLDRGGWPPPHAPMSHVW